MMMEQDDAKASSQKQEEEEEGKVFDGMCGIWNLLFFLRRLKNSKDFE